MQPPYLSLKPWLLNMHMYNPTIYIQGPNNINM
jgi:hypothetical protein